MKKLLFLFAALLSIALATPADAQKVIRLTRSTSTDTVTDATTAYYTGRPLGNAQAVFQLDIKKVSGTVGGYAIIQASSDTDRAPVNFYNISTDTLTLTNGDNVKIWNVANYYPHYRIKLVTTGTQKFTAKGYAFTKY